MVASSTMPSEGAQPRVHGGQEKGRIEVVKDLSGDRKIEVGRVILDVAPRVGRAETNLLAAMDIPLTHRQYRILARVSSGMASPTAISKAASISVAAISESAEALLRRGLLDRETDERDRRASKLSLTDEGRRALKAAEATYDELAAVIVAGLASDDLNTLDLALDKIRDNVRQQLLEGFQD